MSRTTELNEEPKQFKKNSIRKRHIKDDPESNKPMEKKQRRVDSFEPEVSDNESKEIVKTGRTDNSNCTMADQHPCSEASKESKKSNNAITSRVKSVKKLPVERTSKGRGIRLVCIPKLVNFCAATPERIPWSHERRSELFKSVFQY